MAFHRNITITKRISEFISLSEILPITPPYGEINPMVHNDSIKKAFPLSIL